MVVRAFLAHFWPREAAPELAAALKERCPPGARIPRVPYPAAPLGVSAPTAPGRFAPKSPRSYPFPPFFLLFFLFYFYFFLSLPAKGTLQISGTEKTTAENKSRKSKYRPQTAPR